MTDETDRPKDEFATNPVSKRKGWPRGKPRKRPQAEARTEPEQAVAEPERLIPKVNTVNADLLSDEQKQKLRERARKHVTAKRVETAEDEYFRAAVHEEELVDKPMEQLEYIQLDLAGHSNKIMLDGVQFFHGQIYEVTKSVADTMREIVARGWNHEREIGGANRDHYRAPRNTTFSMKTGAVGNAPVDNVTSSRMLGVR